MNPGDHDISPTATCLTCGYALRGLPSHVCPECGQEFNPSDPTTFDDAEARSELRRIKRIRRWQKHSKPPSGLRCIIVVVSTAYLIVIVDVSLFVLAGEPRSTADFAQYLLHLVAVIILALALRSQIRGAYSRYHLKAVGAEFQTEFRTRYASRLVSLCCLIAVFLAFKPLTLTLRFALSRHALEAAAKTQLAQGQSSESRQRVGLFLVNGIYLHNGGQVFFNLTGSSGWVRQYQRFGLLYEPNGRGWAGVYRRCLLNADWSIAEFERRRYTLFNFAFDIGPGLFLPSLSR